MTFVEGVGQGGSRLTWKKLLRMTAVSWKFRKGVTSAICAASQLPGAEPTNYDDDFCDTVVSRLCSESKWQLCTISDL